MAKTNKKGINFFLYDKKERLLCIHKRDNGDKKWDLFGGGVENNENFREALSREVFEELGIELNYNKIDRIEKRKNKETFIIHFPFYKKRLIKLDEGAGFVWLNYSDIQKLGNLEDEALRLLKIFNKKYA